ncbi:mitomycin radical oxidase McrA [Gordonia polyisoprenivorans VH2]|uniref:Mitomycin radical oxidase McrA n=1 Tax=Gordonia polyisoprenivorans (strain DSM 44266 / VH2) TaxID=1112204 RepID=H6MVG6_GORPV|nr:FAD-binding oxidoreductase [Gordonia polyisoprenivorans]AFA74060.1 mitomycin radical oxidase McrA [Gordonia polyisoprenivorans VH2]
MTSTRSVDQADIAALRRAVRGSVHRPTDPGYATVGFNVAVAQRPWAVVDVADAADVAAVVGFAAANSMTVSVWATGHGATGVDGHSILVRTSGLDVCEVDPATRTARVGAGVRWQQVLDAATPLGLAPLCGSAPAVGVAGFLSGGGIGPLVHTVGASSDHVRSITVVTGNGALIRATPECNPELFWGLRGGKATLGLIVEVVIDLLPIPEIFGGALYFDGEQAEAVVRGWRRWATELPREITSSLALMRLPAMPGIPEPLGGRLTVAVRVAAVGDPRRAAELCSGLSALGTPVLGGLGVMPYARIGEIHADPTTPMPVVEAGVLLGDLDEPAVDALLAAAGPASSTGPVIVEVRMLGGAFADEPPVRSALCHRHATAHLYTIGLAGGPEATPGAGVLDAMAPWATGGELPNFAASADAVRIRRCYDEDTFAWLAALAAQHDPHGVLHVGQVVR